MNTNVRSKGFTVCAVVFIFFISSASACGETGTSPIPGPVLSPTTALPTETAFVLPPLAPTATLPCSDGLLFVDDLTIPDYTVVNPGSAIDKQWLVQNSGSCNWDRRYRLRLVSGDPLGASADQALYPARAGMQAAIRIVFTAPLASGGYISEWQAFGPDGLPFGESFAIRIVVP